MGGWDEKVNKMYWWKLKKECDWYFIIKLKFCKFSETSKKKSGINFVRPRE